MTKLFCDICEKEAPNLYSYTVPGYLKRKAERKDGTVLMTFAQPESLQIEICEKCQEKIRRLLNIHK